jgi:hypothetical protein
MGMPQAKFEDDAKHTSKSICYEALFPCRMRKRCQSHLTELLNVQQLFEPVAISVFMADIVVFPEQFSFDVRVQRNNPRRRLTIKNLGNIAAKITIQVPSNDSFIFTDSKGKTMTGTTTVSMNPDSSHCLFVQKRATIGIVPEDVLVVAGGKKTYQVALKPAVSLVSLEELETVTDSPMRPAQPDPESVAFSREDFATDDLEDQPPKQTKAKPAKQAELKFQPMKRQRKPIELPETEEENAEPNSVDTDRERCSEPNSLAPPRTLESAPVVKKPSGIPGRRRHPDLPPESDVLEESLHVKFSLHEEEFLQGRASAKSQLLPWYDQDAFSDVVEPEFSFELMVTGQRDDPVFCIDGDYYDASGRLLSVQQGKGQVIYVTQEGFDPLDE